MHGRNTKYYIENICHQFPNLKIIYIVEYILFIHRIFTSFTYWHSLSFVVICCSSRCHSLSHVVSLFITCYHSLSLVIIRYHSLSLVVTHYQMLSLVVPLVVTNSHLLSLDVIRCPSLSLDVPLVYLFINDHLRATGFVIHITISFTILITVLIIQTIFLYRARRDFM